MYFGVSKPIFESSSGIGPNNRRPISIVLSFLIPPLLAPELEPGLHGVEEGILDMERSNSAQARSSSALARSSSSTGSVLGGGTNRCCLISLASFSRAIRMSQAEIGGADPRFAVGDEARISREGGRTSQWLPCSTCKEFRPRSESASIPQFRVGQTPMSSQPGDRSSIRRCPPPSPPTPAQPGPPSKSPPWPTRDGASQVGEGGIFSNREVWLRRLRRE